MAAADLPQIERERLARIAENRAKLDQLKEGLNTNLLEAVPAKPQAARPRAKRDPKQRSSLPVRSSGRLEGKERPDYRGQMDLCIWEERAPRQPRRTGGRGGEREGGSRGNGNAAYPAWHPGVPEAPADAAQRALEAAEEKQAELKRPSYIKLLSASKVSGGFWLQAPPQLQDLLNGDSDITFSCSDDARPPECFKHTQECRREGAHAADRWSVGFLIKRDQNKVASGGVGFSKNWRGFAIDQFLHPEDCVLFEVLARDAVEVHIFRAWDFATAAQQPEGLAEQRFRPLGAGEELAPPTPASASRATSRKRGKQAAARTAGGDAAAEPDQEHKAEEREQEAEEQEQEQQQQEEEEDEQEQGDDAATSPLHRKQPRSRAASKAGKAGASSGGGGDAKKKRKRSSRAGEGKAGASKAAAAPASRKRKAAARDQAAASSAEGAPDGGGDSSRPAAGGGKSRTRGSRAAAKEQQPAGGSKKPRAAGAAAGGGGRKRRTQAGAAAASAADAAAAADGSEPAEALLPLAGGAAAGSSQEQQQEEEYEVDWIRGTKLDDGGRRLYLVQWVGYSEEWNTWEPAESFVKPVRRYDWSCAIPDDVPA